MGSRNNKSEWTNKPNRKSSVLISERQKKTHIKGTAG